MKHFSSILLCVHPDNLDKALVDRAAEIARKNDAVVKVFHVITEYPEDMSEWWNVRNPQKLHDKLVSEREAFQQTIVKQLKDAGVQHVTHELQWGVHFLQIVKEVLKNKHDLVMITAMRRKLSHILLECPSADLLRHCPCSLWISRGGKPKPTRRVLAAVAGKGGSVECAGLNERIIRTAAGVAESAERQLNIVYALPVYGGKGVKGKSLRPDLVEFTDNLRGVILEKCQGVLAEYDVKLVPDDVYVLPGRAEKVIPGLVKSAREDLVVMGTMAREGLPGVLMGSTAAKVFDHVECPVLAVKPADFVSLVELEEPEAAARAGTRGTAA